MAIQRNIVKIQTPEGHPGFLGSGHIARAVIQDSYAQSDPFILLMDDMLDKKDNAPAGGPHPHAGFETVTLLIEGEMGLGAHQMHAGDMQMMTAGSGIIHTETMDKPNKVRILQLWLALPKVHRAVAPRVQDISLPHVPTAFGEGFSIRVYSGSFAGVKSPVANYVPLILADIDMNASAATTQILPASFNTFLYVLEGRVMVGDEQVVAADQVAWLDKFDGNKKSELKLTAGPAGVRFVLYSARPQAEPIVSHGPFIADSEDDIRRLYKEYRNGRMGHISAVEASQQMIC